MGLGSEIRDPGVKKAPDPGSGSATLISDIPTGTVCIRENKWYYRTVLGTLRI